MNSFLVVGLGNPGNEYSRSRHNVGFLVVDELINRFSLKVRKKKQYHYAVYVCDDGMLFLCKPQTYMNCSGSIFPSVFAVSKLRKDQLLVIVDNFDLPPGMLRLKSKGTASSHNGLFSISNALGTHNYLRLYLGIGKMVPVSQYVLGHWAREEEEVYTRMFSQGADFIESLLSNPLASVMSSCNRKIPHESY